MGIVISPCDHAEYVLSTVANNCQYCHLYCLHFHNLKILSHWHSMPEVGYVPSDCRVVVE